MRGKPGHRPGHSVESPLRRPRRPLLRQCAEERKSVWDCPSSQTMGEAGDGLRVLRRPRRACHFAPIKPHKPALGSGTIPAELREAPVRWLAETGATTPAHVASSDITAFVDSEPCWDRSSPPGVLAGTIRSRESNIYGWRGFLTKHR